MSQGTNLGSQKGRWIILAALVAVLGALLFLLPGGLVQAQDSTTIEYTENSTDVVLTLTAGDPEGATPITWSLPLAANGDAITIDFDGDDGPLIADDAQDNPDFKIDPRSGVLEFKSPPSFETPNGGIAETNGTGSNSYSVVVQATDGDAGATPEDTRSWFKVIVNVSDEEETGTIRLHPTAQTSTTLLQPQVGVDITAAGLMDGDGVDTTVVATYQWYRTTSRSATGTAISSTIAVSSGTGATYTPVHLAGGSSDIGKYLRVVATYADGRGSGKAAEAVSLYPTIRAINDNQAPSFREGATTTRGVRETKEKGVNIGSPVEATDPEGADDEKLTYWLTGSITVDDAEDTTEEQANTRFSIDADTGQLMTKAELNREDVSSYEVTVNVTDSSGDDTDNEATIVVTIEVLELDENPTITGAATIEHVEGTTVLDTDLDNNNLDLITNNPTATPPTANPAQYLAEDPEGDTITFSLGGADKDLFKLDDPDPAVANTKILAFKEKPDFENPMDSNGDNVYEVTVQATDDANMGTKDVTVKVTNMEEAGKVEVTPAQPRIGIPVTAALTDSDIVAYGPVWNWSKAPLTDDDPATCPLGDLTDMTWTGIPGANSASYTPHASDLDYCLRAVAMYNDGFHEGTVSDADATVGLYLDTTPIRPYRFDKTANRVLTPVQYPTVNLPPEFGSASTKRFVPENAAVGNDVGEPVTADDPNGAHTVQIYSLSGTDQASFDIHTATGQLITRMKFNQEQKDKYTVRVTAVDTDGATDFIRVDIYVIDVDEAPRVMEGGLAISGAGSVNYMENGTDAAAAYMASGPMADNPKWTLMGEDARYLMLDGSGVSSMLKFRNSPDYENPVDSGSDNTYNVVVQATDGTYTAMKNVMVMVTNVDELGTLAGEASLTYAEDRTDAVGTYAVSGGTMDDTATWTLEGTDAGDFDITDGVLTFSSAPDYESPMGGANNDSNVYMVTVKASAGGEMAMMEVSITVDNAEEPGTVTLDPARPSVDTEITATLADDDIVETVSWQWAEHAATDDGSMPAEDSADWMDITGATDASYEPDDDDANMWLRATATYEDSFDSGKTAIAVSASVVTQLAVNGPDDVDYDENGTNAVGTYVASGADSVQWSLSGDDDGAFDILGGVLTFSASPNYEARADADMDNVYMVTVVASDGTAMDSRDVAVTVIDVDEGGSVTGLPASAMVGTVLTATLSDPDSGVTRTTWQWDRAGTDIDDATSASYTVAEEDAGMSLEATATYDDVHGTGKMATSEAVMISADVVGRYDTNDDETVDALELSVAISDYLSGELDPVELSEVIAAYING